METRIIRNEEGIMTKELEQRINDENGALEVRLHGRYEWEEGSGNSFCIGKSFVKGAISIKRPNVIIDGSDAEIIVNITDTAGDWSLFFVQPKAWNVVLKNLKIRINAKIIEHCTRMLCAVYNTAYGLKIENCHIELHAEKQIRLVGVYNNGNLNTHMETRADNLVISNSYIRAECYATEYAKACMVYGLYNYLANSISMQNTFVYATNSGGGEQQKAIGVYTNGRFGRFIGNNIKANGAHNVGKLKEQAHAYGFINEGLYSVISANNIVGEWAGKCVGLDNHGEYALVSTNKILATHTICGRSVRNYANNSSIDGNILTSTSRNARLIEHNAKYCVISRNVMEVLMDPNDCQSGCGIYAVGGNVGENVITQNVIKNVKDCGIFADKTVGEVRGNLVISWPNTVKQAGQEDVLLKKRLDESNVRSIYG